MKQESQMKSFVEAYDNIYIQAIKFLGFDEQVLMAKHFFRDLFAL
jgi:hypothetical protein